MQQVSRAKQGLQASSSTTGRPGSQRAPEFAVPQSSSSHLVDSPAGEDDGGEFKCKTCGRRRVPKYAKNQCQTCYKREKKIQKDSDYQAQQRLSGYSLGMPGVEPLSPRSHPGQLGPIMNSAQMARFARSHSSVNPH